MKNMSVISLLRQLNCKRAWHYPNLLLRHRPFRNRSIFPTRRAHSSKPATTDPPLHNIRNGGSANKCMSR